MNALLKITLCAAVLTLCAAARAETVTIADTYIGGTPSHSAYSGDVIGANFQTNSMTVSYSNATRQWDIVIDSLYFQHLGEHGTQMGDLFLSTDGWHPYGAAPYTADNMNTGEDWEYAFVLSNHTATGGTIALYQLDSAADIITSDSYFASTGYAYRKYQEVQVNVASSGPVLASGTFSIAGQNLTLAINTSDILSSYTDFGFHWVQTCGNDVIEGGMKVGTGEAVPEPSTMALLGFALLGALHYRRRFVD